MTNSAVLIDTSIWIDYLRGNDHEAVEGVRDLIATGRARLCGMVVTELLAGIAKPGERDTLKYYLDAVQYLEVSKSTWILAGEISSNLRKKGTTLSTTDLIICALAMETGSEILTTDRHFNDVPGLRLLEGRGLGP